MNRSHRPSLPVTRQALGLAGWIFATAMAAAFGSLFMPGAWYREIAKPDWTPPDWIFGPVWTLLYFAMAVAAWLVWRKGGWAANRQALSLYLAQLVANGLWSWFFFGLQRPALALVDIVILLVLIVATGLAFWPRSKIAAILFVPYLAWVSFATALNAAIWLMNR
jgi:translocator protein